MRSASALQGVYVRAPLTVVKGPSLSAAQITHLRTPLRFLGSSAGPLSQSRVLKKTRFTRRSTRTGSVVSGAASAAAAERVKEAVGEEKSLNSSLPASSTQGISSSKPQSEPGSSPQLGEAESEGTPSTLSSVPKETSAPLEGSKQQVPTAEGAEHAPQSEDAAPPPRDSSIKRLFASWQQGVVASIGAVMGIGFLVYFLYTPVKEDTVHHTAVVASEALGDVRLRSQAIQLSKEVVAEVLRDPESLNLVVDLVGKLLSREETKIAVSSLLQSLFEDHYTQEVTKKFVLVVVRDPWIQDQLQAIAREQLAAIFQSPEMRQLLSQYLLDSAKDSLRKPQLHYETARAVRHSVAAFFNPWWS